MNIFNPINDFYMITISSIKRQHIRDLYSKCSDKSKETIRNKCGDIEKIQDDAIDHAISVCNICIQRDNFPNIYRNQQIDEILNG